MRYLIFVLAFLITGCASNPDKIAAAYVSPLQYEKYDCDQLSREIELVNSKANTLYESLKDERKADNAQMAAGLILFWPALLWLEGGDGPEAAEYAQLKGERETIEKVAAQKDCKA